VGLKVGEPTGFTIRKYFNNVNAFDLTVGTYGGVIGRERDYRQGRYGNTGISVQAHYLWHYPVLASSVVHIYYGFGGQVNSRRYYPSRASRLHESVISVGGTGLGGLEYYLPDGRLSVFVEGGGYAELGPRPLFISPNLSGGVRLNL
jgi:hypothetical protein